MRRKKEIFMITNSISESVGTRKRGFKILTAVITVLFACSVTITAFASANTYEVTVIDGEKSVSITTKSSDPGEIVRQAGMRLGANDELDLSDYSAGKGGKIVIERAKIIRVEDNGIISYFVGYTDTVSEIIKKEGIAINSGDDIGANPSSTVFDGMKLFIKRAFTVSIDADGESKNVPIVKGTVADAIEKSGIKLGADDIVVPSLDSKLIGFTKIKISRVSYKTKKEKESVDFETKIIPSGDMYIDEEVIVTPGVKGEKTVIYTEKYVDGVLDETKVISERTVKKPVDQVKKVGTKKRATLAAFKNTSAPISDLSVPSDLKLDENGVPVEYAYCVSGKATAYTGDPATASGRKPMPGHIAVDPKEFPYGTELYIVSADGKYVYGYCIAADTGGFVSMGNTDVDLYMDNEQMCRDWGNRNVKIYVLN